jgi:glycosyltransferase involved in cell wall biosynthesis
VNVSREQRKLLRALNEIPCRSTMIPNPTFTILINNYNYASYVGRAIESALAQTWPEVQVVVVDDGSSDNSREVIASYLRSGITFLEKANGGQNSAIAHGLHTVAGEYTIILDSDDWLYPDACERIAASIGEHRPNAVMYWLDIYDTRGKKLGHFPKFPFVKKDLRKHVLSHGYIHHAPTSGNAYLTNFLRDAFRFVQPGSFFSDGYLGWAAACTERVSFVEKSLAGYLVHGSNFSTVAGKDQRRRFNNNSYALTHYIHLHAYLESLGVFVDRRQLINAYVWRETLALKLFDGKYEDISWGDCCRYGVDKFIRARHHGWWRQSKNIVFLVVGSSFGFLRDLIRR